MRVLLAFLGIGLACSAIVMGLSWILPTNPSDMALFENFASDSAPLAFWDGTVVECAPAKGAPGLFKARVAIDKNSRRLGASGSIVNLLALREVKPGDRVTVHEMQLRRSKMTQMESFYFISPDLPRPKDAPPER